MESAIILARLEKYEGRVPHMYRCTGGEVTIGIGHAILNPDDALRLAWAVAGRAPTPDEIHADYARVAAAEKGMVAKAYAPLSKIRMENAAIDSLVASDVQRFTDLLASAL